MPVAEQSLTVYLCGPINGCTDDEASNWRDQVKQVLGEDRCLDPMRRDYRGREAECVNEIVELDKEDIFASDIVLANCWQVSVGTSMEIYLAWEEGIPVIAIVPPDAKVSPWLTYHAQVVTSLDSAFEILGAVRA